MMGCWKDGKTLFRVTSCGLTPYDSRHTTYDRDKVGGKQAIEVGPSQVIATHESILKRSG